MGFIKWLVFFSGVKKKQAYDPEKIVIFLFFVWMITESLVGRCLDGVFFWTEKKTIEEVGSEQLFWISLIIFYFESWVLR